MLRDLPNYVLSLGAMLVSLGTVYLTFFDQRTTLTAAVDSVSASVQRGASSNGELRSVSFNYYLEPGVILSAKGTRPLVLTDLQLVRSASLDECEATDEQAFRHGAFEPAILESDSLERLKLEFSLESISADSQTGFALEPRSDLWCLQLTLFDQSGERLEPMLEAFTMDITFEPAVDDDEYPTTSVAIDYPKHPTTLVSKGVF